jgi:hypothetical protein
LILLDEEFETVALRPPHFRVDLFPHQRCVVKAMWDLEEKRKVPIEIRMAELGSEKFVETGAGMLTEKLGSGKSYMILAIISFNPTPRKVAEISYIPFIKDVRGTTKRRNHKREIFNAMEFKGFDVEVRRAYKVNIRATLIFVGKQAMHQWQGYIEEQTTFVALYIENIVDVKKLYTMIFVDSAFKELDAYDIILVKNGKISGAFDPVQFVSTCLEGKKSKYILSIFAELFKSVCFTRVVLDDFDTLEMPSNATVIPAQFTWFVSRTSCKKPPMELEPNRYYTLADHIHGQRSLYSNLWGNRHLLTIFNIQNCEEFINSCMHVGVVRHYSYSFVNPNQQYIQMIGALGGGAFGGLGGGAGMDDANEVLEMINGDAVTTAAERMGLKSDSVADIFEKILGNNCSKYNKCCSIEKYIPKCLEYISSLDGGGDGAGVSEAKLDSFQNNLLRPGPIKWIKENILADSEEYGVVAAEAKIQNKKEKEEYGMAIDRVKSCIGDKECPMCSEEFADEDVQTVILKCCGLVICGFCIGKRMNLQVARDNHQITTVCPRCKTNISFGALIFISKSVNLDDIMSDRVEGVEETAEAPAEPEPEVPSAPARPVVKTKNACVMQILAGLLGEPVAGVRMQDVSVSTTPLGEPTYRKFLIFASFPETLVNLEKEFAKEAIKYRRINGTSKQIKSICAEYELPDSDPRSVNILLVNGSKYCSGLNLQITTDIIYMHRVQDAGTESQLLGRAVRIGRHNDLNVHWLLYTGSEAL